MALGVVSAGQRKGHASCHGRLNRNFGFCFPWWDRLFATYRDQPTKSHEHMPLCLNIFRDRKYRSLHRMLAMPFTKYMPGSGR